MHAVVARYGRSLIHLKNDNKGTIVLVCPARTAVEEFENAALFLWLGLPSTTRHNRKRSFLKTLFKPREFDNTSFRFHVD